jgi:hypothetical protein
MLRVGPGYEGRRPDVVIPHSLYITGRNRRRFDFTGRSRGRFDGVSTLLRLARVHRWMLGVQPTCTPGVRPYARSVPG